MSPFFVGILLAMMPGFLHATEPALSPTPSPQQNAPTLREAFRDDFLIGTAVDADILRGEAPLKLAIATREFNAITPGNSLKPESVQPREGEFRFDDGDRLMEICRGSGAVPIGHTLVWHSQTPGWFFRGPDGKPAGRDLALGRMRAHIRTVVGHYKGRIKQWDVVNEAIDDGPGFLRETPWRQAIGDDYIAEAFRAAHEADPDAILVYNDYNIEMAYKHPKAMRLLKSLLDQGVPLHAVGIQGHWHLGTPDPAELKKAITDFSSLGLKVVVSELDVGVLPTRYNGADVGHREEMTPEERAILDPYTGGLPKEVSAQLAEHYREIFRTLLRHKDKILRVTLWGTHDGDSWLNNFPIRGRTDYPLLFDREGKPKPARDAVLQAAKEAQSN